MLSCYLGPSIAPACLVKILAHLRKAKKPAEQVAWGLFSGCLWLFGASSDANVGSDVAAVQVRIDWLNWLVTVRMTYLVDFDGQKNDLLAVILSCIGFGLLLKLSFFIPGFRLVLGGRLGVDVFVRVVGW